MDDDAIESTHAELPMRSGEIQLTIRCGKTAFVRLMEWVSASVKSIDADPNASQSNGVESPRQTGEVHVQFTRDNPTFVRLMEIVCTEAKLGEVDPTRIRCVFINEYRPPPPRRKMRVRDYIPMVGCLLILGAMASIYILGFITIIRWLIGAQ
jgi:hypothetical protein